jgi:hypothetical protein
MSLLNELSKRPHQRTSLSLAVGGYAAHDHGNGKRTVVRLSEAG